MTAPSHLPLPQAKAASLRLAMASAIAGSTGSIAIGLGGLIGASLLPLAEAAYATVPVTGFVVGSTLASIPAALWMRRVGRRTGFVFGVLVAALGAALSAFAIILGSFWGFTAAMLIIGGAGAFLQQYRFAAADAAEPAFKARAISWVLAGGVISGVIGPQVSIYATGLVPAAPFAGPFIVLVGLFLITAVILLGLKVPTPAPVTRDTDHGRPLAEIVFEPRFLVALLASVASYALMSLVMTATPLAMVAHHHSAADSQLAIQWHVIAMFGPSFFTGALIARFGKSMIAAAGFVLIGIAAAVALTGTGTAQFWGALILLGIGWNFAFIASTAMVAALYRPEEASKVQAVNEFVVFGTVAVASFSSGSLLTTAGWEAINLIVFPVTAICVGLIAWHAVRERRTESAAR